MSAERAENNPSINQYKLPEEELTMPEGLTRAGSKQWMEERAKFQLEGMLHGKIPQKLILPPRYSGGYERRLTERYQKVRATTLQGPTDDSSPGKHTRPHFGSGSE